MRISHTRITRDQYSWKGMGIIRVERKPVILTCSISSLPTASNRRRSASNTSPWRKWLGTNSPNHYMDQSYVYTRLQLFTCRIDPDIHVYIRIIGACWEYSPDIVCDKKTTQISYWCLDWHVKRIREWGTDKYPSPLFRILLGSM